MAEATVAAEEKTEAPAPEAKKKSPLLMMLIAAVVMAAAGFATAKFVVVPMFAQGPAKAESKPAEGEAAKGEIINFEDIIVNPSGTMGQRYLNATIGLEVKDEASKEAVEAARPRVKDALITLLSARTIEELTDASKRESIREAIKDKVNADIAPNEVVAVYFLDFVLQ